MIFLFFLSSDVYEPSLALCTSGSKKELVMGDCRIIGYPTSGVMG